MADKHTNLTSQKWLALEMACTIVDSNSPDTPHRKYTWKHNGEVKQEGGVDKNVYTIRSVDDVDATGWTCEVTDWQNPDFTGNTQAIGTETIEIKVFDNPYVERVQNVPTGNLAVGDMIKPKIVYRSHLNKEEDVSLYRGNDRTPIIEMIGDGGLDYAEFKVAKFARPAYDDEYRIEITPKGENTILFVYYFTVKVVEKVNRMNAAMYTPCVYKVMNEPTPEAGYTIKRYRVEHTDGRLIHESETNTVIVDKSTTAATAGEYVACSRLYKSLDNLDDYRESARRNFTVTVVDNELFDGSFANQSFQFPSGSNVQFNLQPKPNTEGWHFRYSLAQNNAYFVWKFGQGVPKVVKYLDSGYNNFSLSNVQYDDSVMLTVYVSPLNGVGEAATPADVPLFFFQRKLEITDTNENMDIEAGKPLVIEIKETAPQPPAPDSGITRTLAFLKGDQVLAENLPLTTRRYTVTEGSMQDDSGVYSHEYREAPAKKDWHGNGHDIISRKTYTVRVVPNMDFDGPYHQTVQVGQTLRLEAKVLQQPANYTPTYVFKKDGQPLQMANNKVPVYEKQNVTKDDAGVYEFIAFADANANGQIDAGEKVGYRRKVHVVVTDAPPEPPKRSDIVTIFNEFEHGRVSPCPYWVIDELVDMFNDPQGWVNRIEHSVYYNWQVTIFNEFLKGQDIYLQDSKNGYWCIIHQDTLTIETGYGAFKHYPNR